MRLVLPLVLAAAPALADCPPPPDHSEALAALYDRMQAAPDPATAQPLNDRAWELYTDAPDEAAQAVLTRGMQMRESWDLLGALQAFDRLIDYCPDWAEGWNQRAFVHYLNQNFTAALSDLNAALERSPRHLGALSGKALTLTALGREAEAQAVLREALALNPWLPERSLLKGEEL
jgi:tetratricopeptide (TPR) repeat protein